MGDDLMRRGVTRIHVNMHKIRANKKNGTSEPVFTVKRGKKNTYAREVVIRDEGGREVARIVYRPEKPLSCGARAWIEVSPTAKIESLL